MKPTRTRRSLKPLDEAALNELALRYVGRFATTRAKLRSYLARKISERGWEGASEPDFTQIADRFAELGYVNDEAFALAKSRSLSARGYGKRRLLDALHAAGVNEDESVSARGLADEEAVVAALRFAKRRRFGPFAPSVEKQTTTREKALAAMVRAGHGYRIAQAILALDSANDANIDQVLEKLTFNCA
jgi:regulatory protein